MPVNAPVGQVVKAATVVVADEQSGWLFRGRIQESEATRSFLTVRIERQGVTQVFALVNSQPLKAILVIGLDRPAIG